MNSIVSHAERYGIKINVNTLKKSRKKTSNKWFETQDSIDYWEDFDRQKIGWKAVGKKISFSIIEEGVFITAPAAFLTSKYNLYLLAVLLSNYGRYIIYQNSDTTGAGDLMLNIQSLERILVPYPEKEILTEINNCMKNILLSENRNVVYKEEARINKIIYNLFDFNDLEIDLIKGQ